MKMVRHQNPPDQLELKLGASGLKRIGKELAVAGIGKDAGSMVSAGGNKLQLPRFKVTMVSRHRVSVIAGRRGGSPDAGSVTDADLKSKVCASLAPHAHLANSIRRTRLCKFNIRPRRLETRLAQAN